MGLLSNLREKLSGRIPLKARRSKDWSDVREMHLFHFPVCTVCGGTKKLQVHHILPFHLFPESELSPSNLITLCEARKFGINCHLAIGHLGNYRSYNPNVVLDASNVSIILKRKVV